ncbi:hypothetical protein N8563_00845 [bacterium]|nr:hypothetical protein [bacterium]
MDQTCPTPGRSLHHCGTIRPISLGMRAAPTAAAEGWDTPQCMTKKQWAAHCLSQNNPNKSKSCRDALDRPDPNPAEI